jgi:hypothetical protein
LAAVLLARPASALDDRVEATCSAATGGDITSSTISIVCGAPSDQLEALACDHTKPLEDLAESQKDLLGHLCNRLDLDRAQLQAALKVAGEAGVLPDRIADWLIEIAAHYRQLLQQVEAGAGDDPDAARPEEAVDALTGALSVFDAAGDADRAGGRARALLDHARAAARGRPAG